ncbi:trihelix transcription factor DF1-like [Prosopis cineraria]|uniref:trihelix transcription factor DF1-like n=1 Tax=Prosopis cineraria TaxID=364024 RepID=UPI00240F4D6D|nr:trihelix transcription factor DF1-like [Prosopis cineraria]
MPENSIFPEHSIQYRSRTEEDGGEPVSDGCQDEQVTVSAGDVDRNITGGRWPPEETKALLKIRSDMDAAFRDTFPKVHLWEQVSRRLGELGYNRSAKKCQEKFENVYKYYRRTKEGRYGRPSGKTYRFFDLLEPLMNSPYPEKYEEQVRNTEITTTPMDLSDVIIQGAIPHPYPEKNEDQTENIATTTTPIDLSNVIQDLIPHSIRFSGVPSGSTTPSSSEESEENIRKKRKLTQYFERLMNKVLEKQTKLQKNFMEILLKCEQDRMAREEAWKTQELARIKRERELLAEERSIAAAKDAAVLALLRKFAGHTGSTELPENLLPVDIDKDEQENDNAGSSAVEKQDCRNGGNFTLTSPSSSRWPKDEVEALIRLRTNFDVENEGNGLKGSIPIWEEISCSMKKLGYDRSARRCKEKWENMNKYFKRMKKKNQKKPQSSKTCPYFQQLDALYNSEKPNETVEDSASSDKDQLKPEELPIHLMEGQSPSSSDREEGSE